MTADPASTLHGELSPIDLLIAIEEATAVPLRPEYIEGTVLVAPPADHAHNASAVGLVLQLVTAGFDLAGIGNGFAIEADGDDIRDLAIPDFYVLHRAPTDLDEAYRKVHKGWYPIGMVALVGEITSTNHETDTGPKYRSYAAAGVPVYVVVHRQDKQMYVHFEPDPEAQRYRKMSSAPLGDPVLLPAPYPALNFVG